MHQLFAWFPTFRSSGAIDLLVNSNYKQFAPPELSNEVDTTENTFNGCHSYSHFFQALDQFRASFYCSSCLLSRHLVA